MLDLQSMRSEYKRAELDEGSVDASPFVQFEKWFDDAVSAMSPEPNAMVLATASAQNIPNIRSYLLKILDEKGLVLFS